MTLKSIDNKAHHSAKTHKYQNIYSISHIKPTSLHSNENYSNNVENIRNNSTIYNYTKAKIKKNK